MEANHLFDENVTYYDKYRPPYCEKIYKDIFRYSTFGLNKLAIEVGCGTGQATKPFLDTGGKVIAIELGAKLAAYTLEKFVSYHNLQVVNIPFEDYRCEENIVDLIYSAHAFHWVSRSNNGGRPGYPLAHRILVPGGTLAVWWRDFLLSYEEDLAVNIEVQNVCQKYMPSIVISDDTQMSEYNEKRYINYCIRIQRFFRFHNFYKTELKMYNNYRTLSADDYIGLLHTYPKPMSLNAKDRIPFFSTIQEIIAKHGGIKLKEIIHLHMGMKK